MTKGYTSKEKVENYLLQDIDAGFSAQINDWIESVERYIDQYTNRNFIADASASPRSYDGNSRQALMIDDCIAVTEVKVGNDQWGDSQSVVGNTGGDRYYTLPTNNVADKVPINKIGLRTRIFTAGHANHTITAKWGYSENVPKDIEFAATVLVAGIVNHSQGKTTNDSVKSEKIGEYSVTYADEKGFADAEMAKKILDSYMRIII